MGIGRSIKNTTAPTKRRDRHVIMLRKRETEREREKAESHSALVTKTSERVEKCSKKERETIRERKRQR